MHGSWSKRERRTLITLAAACLLLNVADIATTQVEIRVERARIDAYERALAALVEIQARMGIVEVEDD